MSTASEPSLADVEARLTSVTPRGSQSKDKELKRKTEQSHQLLHTVGETETTVSPATTKQTKNKTPLLSMEETGIQSRYHLLFLKCPLYNKKILRHVKKQESVAYTEEESSQQGLS